MSRLTRFLTFEGNISTFVNSFIVQYYLSSNIALRMGDRESNENLNKPIQALRSQATA
jgi:hypothetical protein